jgi:hypothetical protein
MKKILVFAAVLFTAFTVETHAIGLGFQGGTNIMDGFAGGFSVLISPDESKHGAVTWFLEPNTDKFSLGGSFDYWFWPKALTTLGPGALSFYLGAGAYAQIALWDGNFGLDAGIRLPIGLDWKMDFLDVFVQVVPFTGISLLPSPGFGGFHLAANIGARFWIG